MMLMRPGTSIILATNTSKKSAEPHIETWVHDKQPVLNVNYLFDLLACEWGAQVEVGKSEKVALTS